MARKYDKYLSIDADAFKSAVKEKGITLDDLSRKMRYGHSTLSAKLRNGRFTSQDAMLVEMIAEIPLEAYQEKPKHEATPKVTQMQIETSIERVLGNWNPIDYERLYKIIYSATLEAMKQALMEDSTNENG